MLLNYLISCCICVSFASSVYSEHIIKMTKLIAGRHLDKAHVCLVEEPGEVCCWLRQSRFFDLEI